MKYKIVFAIVVSLLSCVSPRSATAGCAAPAGSGGDLFFNSDEVVMQYCNGADWVAFPKVGSNAGFMRTARASVKNTTTSNLTTPSFTPADDTLLVAVVSGVTNWDNGTAAPNPTVSGGSLTWTRSVRARNESAEYDGWWAFSEIWTAPVTTGASMTVTLALSRSVNGKALNVYEYTGYDAASPVGATVSATRQGASGSWTISLSDAPAVSSEILAAVSVNNWTVSNPITSGTGWTETYKDQNLGSETDAQIQVLNVPASENVLWDNVNVSGWNQAAAAAAVEIKATTCANPSAPAGTMLFNEDHRVLQWCDGSVWQGAGPPDPGGAVMGCANPVGVGGTLAFNADYCVLQYCDGADWRAIPDEQPDSCACGTPAVGTVCKDGSVYAGLSPDGNVKMYTTPADAPALLPWNNGNTTGYTLTNVVNTTTGEENTSTLVSADADSVTAGVQPHQASAYCAGLLAHGRDDWYLPSVDEAAVINGHFTAIGGFQAIGNYAIALEFSTSKTRLMSKWGPNNWGPSGGFDKNTMTFVRCVRK